MSKSKKELAIEVINGLRDDCHETAVKKGWWEDERNQGELIALMHSELSEALEWLRETKLKMLKNKNGFKEFSASSFSNHISDYLGIEEEFADVIIRILDFCGHHKLRIGEALLAKMEYNLKRPYRHGNKTM